MKIWFIEFAEFVVKHYNRENKINIMTISLAYNKSENVKIKLHIIRHNQSSEHTINLSTKNKT